VASTAQRARQFPVVAVRTIAERDPLRQSASLLFKAVVFRPDGHSDFMTGPEGYSTSVLAGDDWPGRLPYLPSPGLLAVFFYWSLRGGSFFFPRRPRTSTGGRERGRLAQKRDRLIPLGVTSRPLGQLRDRCEQHEHAIAGIGGVEQAKRSMCKHRSSQCPSTTTI
jgi:hypothetical protein